MAVAARNQGPSGRAASRPRRAPSRPKLKVIQGGRSGVSAARPAARTDHARTRRPSSAASRTRQVSRPVKSAAGLTAIALSAVFVLPLVLLNVYVAQSSFELNELQKQVSVQQNKYRQMRYQVSMAESPARLAEVAGSLGLVTPAHQESLEGQTLRKVVSRGPEGKVAAPTLKALLADRP